MCNLREHEGQGGKVLQIPASLGIPQKCWGHVAPPGSTASKTLEAAALVMEFWVARAVNPWSSQGNLIVCSSEVVVPSLKRDPKQGPFHLAEDPG